MKPLRVLIVDDEPLIRTGIRKDLAELPGVEIAGECGSVAETVETIRSTHFDLVLLDIQMPDGTGFDVIRQIGPDRMPAVVFVTAYDEYAIQAFEVNAVDYVLKPFDSDRLRESVARARQRLAHPAELIRQLESVLQTREERWTRRLVVRDGERYEFVPVDSIEWIESANNYAVLHCRSKDHLFAGSLASLERMLDPAKFLRVHRRHIVNLSRIVAAYPIAGGIYELELESGVRVGTGRQYAERVRQLLKPSV